MDIFNMYYSLWSIFNVDIVKSFYQICLSIDVLLYKLIGSTFQIFNILSEARLFSSEALGRFTSRIYLIISVVMLFILAYSFLTVIINPDNMTKGNSSPGKIVKNIIVALIVLVFTPTAFNYAYGFQTSLIKNNVIGKLVLGAEKSEDIYTMSGEFSTTVFTGSYYLAETHSEEAELYYDTAVMSSKLENNVMAFVDTIPYVQTGDIEYNYIISTVVGIFVLYILLTFIFDLALRAVKLAFLELFAPVPALLYMIPGKEKSLNTWFKDTLQTFFEVFVRIGVLFFCVYLIAEVDRSIDNILGFNQVSGFMVRNICRIFVIIGILLFAKQAPQLICDILGIKYEGGLLSLRKRINDTKEAIKGVAAPVAGAVNRIGGAALGLAAAKRAYKKGIELGNKDTAAKRALATFHGLRNGYNGGIRNFGSAYNYEMESQRSYALDSNKSDAEQIKNASLNALRDNFGFQSRYNDEVREQEIRRDAQLASAYHDLREIESKTRDKIRVIDERHKATLAANQEVNEKAAKYGDEVEAETSKEDNKTFSTNKSMIATKHKELMNDRRKVVAELNDTSISNDRRNELNKELAQNTKELRMLDTAKKYFDQNKLLDGSYNNYGLKKEMERISELDDSEMNRELKNALNFVYHEGQDQNKVKYLQDESKVTTKIKMAEQELKMALRNEKAGKAQVAVKDAQGNITGYTETTIKNLREIYDEAKDKKDYIKILKLKKESGIILDSEKMTKNDALALEPVTVNINNEGDREYQLYDLQQIQDQLKDKIETLNKEVEKFIEARKSEEQAADIRRKRDDNRPKHVAKKNN